MKTSRLAMTATVLSLALAGLIQAGLPGPSYAQSSTTGYQQWSGYQTEAEKKQAELVTKLRDLIAKAEKNRAADPAFLEDLKKLADQYTVAGGKGYVFLSDTFKDGNFNSNPTWKVSAGTWGVDTSGANIGLVSKIRQQQGDVNQILGTILGIPQQTAPQDKYASIYTPVKFTNAFVIKMKFTSKDPYGGLNIVPYQGASGQNAYRLVYQPNSQKGLVLQRVLGNQVSQVAAYNGSVRLEDGKPHDLVWSRDSQGKMTVTIDGQQAIAATDTKVPGNLEGLLLINVGGSYWIREVKIEGNA